LYDAIDVKRVFASQNVAALTIVCDLLAQEGIETKILNEKTASVLGEIPFLLAMPEVWVLHDEDEPAAQEIVGRYESGEIREELSREPWECPRCGETIEGQFTECWRCEDDDPRKFKGTYCLQCGYLLWALPERRCPECGTEF
jgi:hypothetical protein